MTTPRKDGRTRPTVGAMPRSPAEALEPTRAPARPRGARRRREVRRLGPTLRAVNGFLTFAVVIMLVIGGAAIWIDSEIGQPGPLTAPKTFVVRKAEGTRDIAQRLESDGVIRSQHLFVANYVMRSLSAMFGGRPLQLKAGDYLFEPGQSIEDVAEIIGEGKSVLLSITIPEGLTSYQIAERLKNEQGLTGNIEVIPPEGALMPDTYKVNRSMTRQAVLDMMRAEGERFLRSSWDARAPNLPFKTPQDALTLASIVEKETGRRDERDKVAAVFVNRLRMGMRLQSDPTILYGLHGSQVAWGRPITRADIQSRTPHNTYQVDGLPATPICNPGRAAIQAVLNPAKTSALYFVANGSGGHTFTDNLKDHNAAVTTWRRIEKDIRARQAEAAARSKQTQAAPAAEAPMSAGPGVADEPDPADAPVQPAPASKAAPATPGVAKKAPVAAAPPGAAPAKK